MKDLPERAQSTRLPALDCSRLTLFLMLPLERSVAAAPVSSVVPAASLSTWTCSYSMSILVIQIQTVCLQDMIMFSGFNFWKEDRRIFFFLHGILSWWWDQRVLMWIALCSIPIIPDSKTVYFFIFSLCFLAIRKCLRIWRHNCRPLASEE